MTVPSVRRGSPALVGVALLGCGDAVDPSAIVRGTLVGLAAERILATVGSSAVADAPIEPGGGFLLVIPTATEVGLAVTEGAAVVPIASESGRALSFVGCAGADIELGLVSPWCADDGGCEVARSALGACEAETAHRCRTLGAVLERCRKEADVACRPILEEVERCHASGGDCAPWLDRLRTCFDEHSCRTEDELVAEHCTDPCRGERAALEACPPPHACGPGQGPLRVAEPPPCKGTS